MATELIICEKPSAAKKIAEALADNSPEKKQSQNKVSYYELRHNGKKIIVVSAVGHIYGLAQKEKNRSIYPVFDIDWIPSHEVNKDSAFTKKYLSTIKSLAKKANEFTVATDYDIEGEVIGHNIMKYACNQEDASRMKFSTLTKSDLIKSYESKSPTINWPQAKAGETRHKMDWFFGINISRALTASIKKTGSFKLMSTGRVQGPALKLIVEKEKAILAFIPEPYWEILLNGTINNNTISALHIEGKIFDKDKSDKIFDIVKNEKNAKVKEVKKKQFKTLPPVPFDLTSMQIEAHKCLRISPKDTLSTAQELYTQGAISYPRTSSQVLPKEIGFKDILTKLLRQSNYITSINYLLKKPLIPNNGKKTDPAHPAIYPTGSVPKFKTDYERKLYDLIVKRFFAVFGEAATRETMTVSLDCNKEIFIAKGTVTVDQGWFNLYNPYVMLKDEELPKINNNDICHIKKIEKLDKKTTPPKRFTDASIIKELEKQGLGTKATRAQIIETLKKRGYVNGKALCATKLGIRIENTLEKYSPKIVEPQLTRDFESEMRKIRDNKASAKKVLDDSKKVVIEIIDTFNSHLSNIGSELLSADRETRDEFSYIGKCLKCEDGELHLRKGKFGQFIACNKYPDCKTTYNVPKTDIIKNADEPCEKCKYPLISVQKKKNGPQKFCINPDCETRQIGSKIKHPEEGTICPNCKKGKMILRKSFYGEFLGCDNYPKCKTMMKIENGKVNPKVITS